MIRSPSVYAVAPFGLDKHCSPVFENMLSDLIVCLCVLAVQPSVSERTIQRKHAVPIQTVMLYSRYCLHNRIIQGKVEKKTSSSKEGNESQKTFAFGNKEHTNSRKSKTRFD